MIDPAICHCGEKMPIVNTIHRKNGSILRYRECINGHKLSTVEMAEADYRFLTDRFVDISESLAMAAKKYFMK